MDVRAPQSTWIQEFLYVPSAGDLTENKGLQGSIVSRDYSYPTPGYKYIWFYADAP
jgi:hypothetical protein